MSTSGVDVAFSSVIVLDMMRQFAGIGGGAGFKEGRVRLY